MERQYGIPEAYYEHFESHDEKVADCSYCNSATDYNSMRRYLGKDVNARVDVLFDYLGVFQEDRDLQVIGRLLSDIQRAILRKASDDSNRR